MKRARVRFLLNDPDQPLRFRVREEGKDYVVYEGDVENLVSSLEDLVEWAAKKVRKAT